MKNILCALFLFVSSIAYSQEWQNCPVEETKPLAFKSLTASTEQVLTYRVDIIKHPKVSGKTLTSQQVYDVIDKALATAYGDKLAIEFKRVTGSARFVYRFENHRDRYRGTHFSDQYIMLHSEAPWSLNGIGQIAAHEIGHSGNFFGYGHNNESFVENGVRYSHLMNPDDPSKAKKYKTYPTLTSPEEINRLAVRWGRQPDTTPTPPKPSPEPTPADPNATIKIEAEKATSHNGIIPVNGKASGGRLMGWINRGESMTFKFNAPAAGTYTITHYVASPQNGASLSANGKKVNIPNTRGWDTWKAVKGTITLKKGSQNLVVKSESNAGWNYDYFTLKLNKPVDPKQAAIKKLQTELAALRKTRDKHKSDLATHNKAIESATKKRNASKASLDASNKMIAAKNKELAELTK